MQKFAKFCLSTKYSWLLTRNTFFQTGKSKPVEIYFQKQLEIYIQIYVQILNFKSSRSASDLSLKILREKISNSIAIQTSRSLKGWQNEWRCSSKDAFASSREKCTWRINTPSTMSKSKVCCAFNCSCFHKFAVLRPSRLSCLVNILVPKIFGYICAQIFGYICPKFLDIFVPSP